MKTSHRRYWVFLLLFLFNAIAYVDRVNMSVAGKPIAQEFDLSPVALGYLFSSFLWAYVLMMLPGGRLIDRWGTPVVASVATAVWSAAQMLTGAAGSFVAMLLTRLGLGIGEAPFAPVTYNSVRSWSPYTERGTAIAAISAGSSLGLALGAPAVAWLIQAASWRWSFVITGAVGFVWVVAWSTLVSTPEKTRWLPEAERRQILAGRDAGMAPPSHDGVGYLGLVRCPTMWGLFISQGCLVYTVYLYMSWLPNYLQTARHLSMVGSGIYTAIPFFVASAVNIVANWCGDRLMSAEAVHRRQAPLPGRAVPAADRGGVGDTVRPVADRGHSAGHDRGVVRQCRAGGEWRLGRRSAALAGRRRARLCVSRPWRQHLWLVGADRDRVSGRGHQKLQFRLYRRRRAGAGRRCRRARARPRRDRRGARRGAGAAGPRRLTTARPPSPIAGAWRWRPRQDLNLRPLA